MRLDQILAPYVFSSLALVICSFAAVSVRYLLALCEAEELDQRIREETLRFQLVVVGAADGAIRSIRRVIEALQGLEAAARRYGHAALEVIDVDSEEVAP